MTDPRLAPLAAALQQMSFYPYRSGVDYGAGRPIDWKYLHEQEREALLADAAAILAELPDDWCGHDPTLYVQVADLTERLEAAESQSDREQAEIARLRKIEEAAREITSDREDNYCFSCHDTLPCAHDDLRAALGAER